ncbi:MAG: glycosyltransferase family 2 protein [Patescibacteria group bacterium]
MLSIVIVNYKNAPLLRLCLKSLRRVISDSFVHEIIVVDASANADTVHIATEEFPHIRYLPFKENIGYTRAVNHGLKTAKGDFIFIINADIIPLEGSLEKMYAYMKSHPEIGLLGPRLLNFDGSTQQSCFRFYTPFTIICRRTFLGKLPFVKNVLNRFLMKDKDLTQPLMADWLMGSALMVSRQALETVGYMDEQFYLYMSDVDWPRHFWENGYQVVFFPLAMIYHYHRQESHGALDVLDAIFNRRTQQHITDALRYFRKNGVHKISYV